MSEASEQEALMQWATIKGYDLLFHIPNGGSRHPAEAMNLKKQGVKKGVPDLFLPVPRGGFHGLFIEMKATKGRLSIEQKAWLGALVELGYQAVVCYGFDDARKAIEGYMAEKKDHGCSIDDVGNGVLV